MEHSYPPPQVMSCYCYFDPVSSKQWTLGWWVITWRVDPMTMLRSARVEWAVEISRSLLGSSSSQSRTKSQSLPRQGRLSPCWWGQFVPRGFCPTAKTIVICWVYQPQYACNGKVRAGPECAYNSALRFVWRWFRFRSGMVVYLSQVMFTSEPYKIILYAFL